VGVLWGRGESGACGRVGVSIEEEEGEEEEEEEEEGFICYQKGDNTVNVFVAGFGERSGSCGLACSVQ
jgi:hypothetical protein